MFFFFSKILAYFIKPFNIFLLILVASFLTKNRKWKKRLRVTSVIVFLVFSNGIILNECLKLWEKPAIPISDLDDDYELAVVLGGTTDVDREPKDRLFFHKGAEISKKITVVNCFKSATSYCAARWNNFDFPTFK